MEIPEGYFNTRYIFTCQGVTEEMSFAIGGQAAPGDSASLIAFNCYDSALTTIIPSAAGILLGWTFVGTQTTRTIAGEPQVGEWNGPLAGTGVGDGVIVNSAVLVKKTTASGGRKNRGRCYVPPYGENNGDIDTAGNMLPAHRDALQSNWEAFNAALSDNGVPPWLLHSDPVAVPTPIQSFVVQGLLATQRRRMR